ncbi:hypothetical protein SDC9_66341 [bioreactor metagenome]|uniref:Type IX secretion system membrane protein PorP/SprF n=1 Tax=bioreactor metagenome TaxID=1076179 RepID=A0A644Y106_9ZZZZ
MSEQYRLSANTKVQWKSVTAPYQTYLAAGDVSLQRKGNHLGKVGLGLDFMREKAGDAGFGTSGFGLSVSYIKALNRLNNRFLSGGVSMRMYQRSFDPDELTFDNQFNGLTYDPQLSGNEIFSEPDFWYPSAGAGIAYLARFDSRHEIISGLSVQNINRPQQSHFNDSDIRLRTRWIADVSYKSGVTRNSAVYPSLFFSKQGVFTELILGADYRYVKSFDPWAYKAYSGGLFYRAGDGFILTARLDYLNYRFGISYDVNTSKLVPASQLRGGFEFSIVAVFTKPERKTNREIPCPIF